MKILISILLVYLSFYTFSQNYTIPLNPTHNKSQIKTPLDKSSTYYTFSYKGITLKEISTQNGNFNQLIIPETFRSGKPGEPQLVSSNKLISIPANSNVSVEVVSFTTDDYKIANYFADNKIIPYQPPVSKNTSPKEQPFVQEKNYYQKDTFPQLPIASIKILGKMRGEQIAKLTVNPLSYNPATNTLRVFNDIKIKIVIDNDKKVRENPTSKSTSTYFTPTLKSIEPLIPASYSYPDNPDLSSYPDKFLIIASSEYLTEMQDFIKWKTEKGFIIIEGNTNIIGTSSSAIKTWIQNQYNNTPAGEQPPSFLLLVGDVQQIPVSQSGNSTHRGTDLYYASVDGDMFPDMYYGRLPAADVNQLRDMLNKILTYEKYNFTDDSFLDDVTLIAGADGTWNPRVGQPTINYGTENYFNTTSGFNNINAYLTSYTGCYDVEKIGVSLINYTAHCTQTSWYNPSLSASSVKSMENTGKYGIAIGNCCTSADFNITECIGEAWLRNPQGGAVAYIGSVPDTYWWEDFYWSVGAHQPIYNEYPDVDSSSIGVFDAPFSDYKSVDAWVFAGNLAVTEAHNEGYPSDINSLYYWEAYHCLGDPSVVPYLTRGKTNTVYHNDFFPDGALQFEVKTTPGSMVALSGASVLIGTATAGSDSIATVIVDTIPDVDSITVVVTRPQYKPYIATIPYSNFDRSYLIVSDFIINDSTGNGNNSFDYSETGNLIITLKNIGNKPSENGILTIKNSDSTCTLFNNTNIPTGTILPNGTITLSNFFDFIIKDSITDQSVVSFFVTASDSTDGEDRRVYNSKTDQVINAPILSITDYMQIDDFDSNGNKVLDYGENATIIVALANTGHSQVSSTVSLINNSQIPVIQISDSLYSVGYINSKDTIYCKFPVSIQDNAYKKSADTLTFIVDGINYKSQKQIIVSMGQQYDIQVGTGKTEVATYPYNNYYQNNSSQILYRSSDLSQGIKTLKGFAFDISSFTTDDTKRDLANFSIKISDTDLSEITTETDMQDAITVFDTSVFMLPAQTGADTIIFETPYIFKGNNIIIDIRWGQNDGYSAESDRTMLYSSLTDYKSVVWGADDNNNPAPIDAISYYRPNTNFIFDTTAIINLSVKSNLPVNNSILVSNCITTIAGYTKTTDTAGRVQYYFTNLTDTNEVSLSSPAHYDTTLSIITNKLSNNIEITMRRHPEFTLFVKTKDNEPAINTNVLINDCSYLTDSSGHITNYSTPLNEYVIFSVNENNYYPNKDSLFINADSQTDTIDLIYDFPNLKIYALNSDSTPIENMKIILDTTTLFTNQQGLAVFEDIAPVNYLIQFYHSGYSSVSEYISVNSDTTVKRVMYKNGDVSVKLIKDTITVNNTGIFIGEHHSVTDINGIADFYNIPEGKYFVKTDTTNYYVAPDSIELSQFDTSFIINILQKPDITFFVTDGVFPIKDIDISLDTIMQKTDNNGITIFSDLTPGKYAFSINTPDYYQMSEDLTFTNNDTSIYITLQNIPDLIFYVKCNEIPVSNAMININNSNYFSDSSGIINIKNISTGTYNYTISKEGYYSIENNIIVTDADTSCSISLNEIPDITFYVVSVFDEVLDSVSITLNNTTMLTGNTGKLTFKDIPAGAYNFTAVKEGFTSFSKDITIDNNDTIFYISLKNIPEISFTVVNGNLPVSNAIVTLDSITKTTSSDGIVTYSDLQQGSHLLSIKCEGYNDYLDTIDVADYSVMEYITLIPILFTVDFNISYNNAPVDSAKVIFNDNIVFTNPDGTAVYTDLFPGNYPYSVNKYGFNTDSGIINITTTNISKSIVMEPILYDVTFVAIDNGKLISGLNVYFNKMVKISNEQGVTEFENVKQDNNLTYYFWKNDIYPMDSGTVNIKSDTLFIINTSANSIETNSPNISVYPNPSHNFIYLTTKLNDVTHYIIYDNFGRVVKLGETTLLTKKIDISNLTNGLYYIKITTGSNLKVIKFMKR